MNIEVLLSVMNLEIKDLDKTNISGKCCVINQCNENNYFKYKNFFIYSYAEKGLSKSRNRGLEKASSDIILLCDDDVKYSDNYENDILNEFNNNPDADIIIFNLKSIHRENKVIKKNKKLHLYNSLGYSSPRIAFKRKSILDRNISFNEMFGSGSIYSSGEDVLFIVDSMKSGLNVYLSCKCLGEVDNKSSNWFKGYNEKFFFDKGALYTAINMKFRYIYMLQFLIRHHKYLNEVSFSKAYKLMRNGSNDYIKRLKKEKIYDKS